MLRKGARTSRSSRSNHTVWVWSCLCGAARRAWSLADPRSDKHRYTHRHHPVGLVDECSLVHYSTRRYDQDKEMF